MRTSILASVVLSALLSACDDDRKIGNSPTTTEVAFQIMPLIGTDGFSSSDTAAGRAQEVFLWAEIKTAEGQPPAQGNVRFRAGDRLLGVAPTAAHSGGGAGCPVGGCPEAVSPLPMALLRTTDLPAGVLDIVASYSGDSVHAASDSAPVRVIVSKAAVSLSSSPNPATAGAHVQVFARMEVAGDEPAPTGMITFRDGLNSTLGVAPLTDVTQNSPPRASVRSVVAQIDITAGTDPFGAIKAFYSGDASYPPQYFPILTQRVE